MAIPKANSAFRSFVFSLACVLLLGIYLTGFNVVHWVLYIPTAAMFFAAITGICPGMIMSNKMFGKKS